MNDPDSHTVRLLIFAKLPRPGNVKTRLASAVGEAKAAALYRAWVPPFLRRLAGFDPGWSLEISLAPEEGRGAGGGDPIEEARNWLGLEGVDWSIQSGQALGERLTRGFERQFALGWSRVFALGTDSPQLAPDRLLECFDLLDRADLALGPTEDGGYYTIGMKQRPGRLFRSIRWSSPETLEDTQQAARSMGWVVKKGTEAYDIDTIQDLNRLIQERAVECWPELMAILKED